MSAVAITALVASRRTNDARASETTARDQGARSASASHGRREDRDATGAKGHERSEKLRASDLNSIADALSKLSSSNTEHLEKANKELAALKLQTAEAATSVFHLPSFTDAYPSDLVTRADRLMTKYVNARKEILSEMYAEYLERGAGYDPKEHLAKIADLAEHFEHEAEDLEATIPGITSMRKMIDETSLRRPSFLEELTEDT